jgi:hypothetical protein
LDEDRIASNWLQVFVYNSSTDSLRTAVAKKYDKLPLNQKGGVTYLFLTLCEMFQMSREVKEAMFKFLDIFKRNGVSRYTGENILVVSEEILGVCKRLDAIKALQEEHVTDVLSGLSICTNKRFRDMFNHLKQNAELDNLHILGTVPINASSMEQIKAILDKAVDTYDKLCTAQIWNSTNNGGPRAVTSVAVNRKCWNCNGSDHQAQTCPKAQNKALFEKNRKAFQEAKKSGNKDGATTTRGGSDNVDGTDNTRKKWDAQGMSMINGVLHVHCKQCGPNTTHSTGLHKAFIEQGSSFKLASTHPYAKECIKLGQNNPAISKAMSTPSSTSSLLSSSTGSSMISIDRSKLEQNLADFERSSTDPNASQLSEMFRTLFLN